MRTVYLIRHAQAEQTGGRRCVSRTDGPLSAVGREQAKSLRQWAAMHPVTSVWSSPAVRCRETALALCEPESLHVLPELWEVNVGAWEGLTFDEIRLRWPKEYEERGEHLGTAAPPGGESFLQAGKRLEQCLASVLKQTEGDIAVVAHGGIFRGWLCEKLGIEPDAILTIPQPWSGVTTLEFEPESGCWTVIAVGVRTNRFPGEKERQALFARCGTPEPVQAHCRAVAGQAEQLADRISKEKEIDRELLQAAALLHDLCRTAGREHPARAAALLEKEGYPALAAVIGQHHDMGPDPSVEAELLYLADKLISGTEPVSLKQRFENARQKCTTPDALAAWQRRWAEVKCVAQKYGCELE